VHTITYALGHTHTHARTHTICERQGRTGNLALTRWAGWSAGQVGRHVICWRREWNGWGGPGTLS